jgi:hypothetical protein
VKVKVERVLMMYWDCLMVKVLRVGEFGVCYYPPDLHAERCTERSRSAEPKCGVEV